MFILSAKGGKLRSSMVRAIGDESWPVSGRPITGPRRPASVVAAAHITRGSGCERYLCGDRSEMD